MGRHISGGTRQSTRTPAYRLQTRMLMILMAVGGVATGIAGLPLADPARVSDVEAPHEAVLERDTVDRGTALSTEQTLEVPAMLVGDSVVSNSGPVDLPRAETAPSTASPANNEAGLVPDQSNLDTQPPTALRTTVATAQTAVNPAPTTTFRLTLPAPIPHPAVPQSEEERAAWERHWADTHAWLEDQLG
ncbi:MAG: hypothetical protein U5O16_12875 [Rhodococcus sp. (in: high G+C Gram-positive bacteria)]|uniref:hypothetical protein n=1 Tax=Rhodococcus sp. TaxID=1831 RepID=UPI002ADB72A7|nr:hypothetical protein [Rhodococcus sp. (in: high G+C Gram-positive bacteria)]